MGAECALVKDLIKIDLEAKPDLWIYRHLPEEKNGFQKTVMAPIGTVDAKNRGGMALAGADRPDNPAAMRFVKKENPQMS